MFGANLSPVGLALPTRSDLLCKNIGITRAITQIIALPIIGLWKSILFKKDQTLVSCLFCLPNLRLPAGTPESRLHDTVLSTPSSQAMSGKTSGCFSRVRGGARRTETADRPPSARSSFVDRLRSMKLDPLSRTVQNRAATPATTARAAADAESTRAAAEASRMASATAATAVRRSAALEQLNQSQLGRPNSVQKHSPNKQSGGRDTAAHAASGLRVTGPADPTSGSVRAGIKPQPRANDRHIKEISPPRAYGTSGRQGGSIKHVDRGLKVAITLMTRKPHRFDWYRGRPLASCCPTVS